MGAPDNLLGLRGTWRQRLRIFCGEDTVTDAVPEVNDQAED